jgi:WD40 repeat protein
MAIGNLLLATHTTDGNVRVYELSGGVFNAGAVMSGFPHSPPANSLGVTVPPVLQFLYDSAYLGLQWQPSATAKRIDAISNVGTSLGFYQAPGSAGTYIGFGSFSADYSYLFGTVAAGNIRNSMSNIGAVGIRDFYLAVTTEVSSTTDHRSTLVSPDGNVLFIGQKKPSASKYYYLDTGKMDHGTPFQSLQGANAAAWSKDSQYLVTASHDNLNVEIWKYASGAFTKLQDLTPETDKVKAIDFSVNGKYLVISYKPTSGTIYTVVYKRLGPFYQKQQTISGVGDMLGMDYEGKYFFDAVNKKAYSNDGSTFTEMVGAMAALTGTVDAQTVSTHVPSPIATTKFYDDALVAFLGGTVHTANLRIQLLTASASFDHTHANLSQVTNSGAYVPTGGAWPSTGLALTGVAQGGSTDFFFTVDDVDRVIVNSVMHCRYAVIYDDAAAGDQPLIWIDLAEDKTVLTNTQITFSWLGNHLVSLTS